MNFRLPVLLSLLIAAPIPALAWTPNMTSWLLNNELIPAIQATGTVLLVDSPDCKENEVYGRYAYLAEQDLSVLQVCTEVHEDYEELYDTVRHEAWHLVQRCKGGPLFSMNSLKDSASPEEVSRILGNYPVEHHHMELEAFSVAADKSEEYISNQLRYHCSGS